MLEELKPHLPFLFSSWLDMAGVGSRLPAVRECAGTSAGGKMLHAHIRRFGSRCLIHCCETLVSPLACLTVPSTRTPTVGDANNGLSGGGLPRQAYPCREARGYAEAGSAF